MMQEIDEKKGVVERKITSFNACLGVNYSSINQANRYISRPSKEEMVGAKGREKEDGRGEEEVRRGEEGGWGEHTLHLSLDTVETSEPEDLASPQLPLGMVDLLLVVGQLVLRHLIRAVPVPCRLQTLQLVGWHGGNQLGNTAKDEEEGGRRRGVIGKVRC